LYEVNDSREVEEDEGVYVVKVKGERIVKRDERRKKNKKMIR